MLIPEDQIIAYIKKEYAHLLDEDGRGNFEAIDIENIMFNCNEGDMDFFIEELISSAGEGDATLNISYYDDNSRCICLVSDVDYTYYDMTPEDIAELILGRDSRVKYFKKKFLKLKED